MLAINSDRINNLQGADLRSIDDHDSISLLIGIILTLIMSCDLMDEADEIVSTLAAFMLAAGVYEKNIVCPHSGNVIDILPVLSKLDINHILSINIKPYDCFKYEINQNMHVARWTYNEHLKQGSEED